jgi:predicted MPP superfamily phosphohydrolase
LHVDYTYSEGYSADCRERRCCHESDGISGTLSESYGHFNCDTPSDAIDKMLSSISAAHTPDLVLITGGIVSRDTRMTKAEALISIDATLMKVKLAFPGT